MAKSAGCFRMHLLFLVLAFLQCGHTAKIAVLTFPNGISHFFMQEPIGRELEARGHEVIYIMCSMESKSSTVKVKNRLIYHFPQYPVDAFIKKVVDVMLEKGNPDLFDIKDALKMLRDACDALLMNETLLAQLKGTDILFADITFSNCGQLLKIKAQIPYLVDFGCWGFNDPFTGPYGIPWPLSYIPSDMTMASTEMPFRKRVLNTVLYGFVGVVSRVMTYFVIGSVQRKHGIALEKSPAQIIGESDLLLLPLDWSLEWTRPIPPNVKLIGSPSLRPSGKLTGEFKEFMESAKGGVILVSFGSMVTYMEHDRMARLLEAFSKLKYKVLWKFNQTDHQVINVKTVTWLPQNDLLGHPNMKLFMTHGGANSIYEGCNHGVPLLVTPLWGDQFGNAEKIKVAGIGADFNLRKGSTFNSQSLVDLINELIENPRYKSNAMKMAKLLNDRPHTPPQEAADWIEYVIRQNGTSHLRPKGLDLAVYEFYLLDVGAFFLAIVAAVVFILVGCFKFL